MNNANRCPKPENESQRLEAVRAYKILDTPPEIDFDALTRVTSHTFSTPVAVVGLMDSDRLWFKSRLGLDVPQLDRQIAFCAHAVMKPGELLVIDDLQQDPRFKDNPLVINAPHVRFYAGSPLVDHNGLALGTIAVVDTKPRSFNDHQRLVLRDLSTLVMVALDNRRRSLILEQMAMTDHLTGLANRVHFDHALESEMASANRTGNSFTLLCMDLDGFKKVNDQFGHASGDEVLCEIARRITTQLRTEDLASRFGGDEFGVLMRNGSLDSAQMLAHRIIEAVSAPITLFNGAVVSVGISIGIAAYSASILSEAELIAGADKAMYQSKQSSNKRYHLFST
jgi:diguanylate cyclase (GGDEF)-like protein